MPKVSCTYASPWLNAVDLQGRTVTVTIAGAVEEEIRQRDNTTLPRIVLAFIGKKKRMILNKTQATALAGALGDEAADWRGARITLRPGTAHNGLPTLIVGLANGADPASAPEPTETEDADPDPLAERLQGIPV